MTKNLKLIYLAVLLFLINNQTLSKENFFNKAIKLYEEAANQCCSTVQFDAKVSNQ